MLYMFRRQLFGINVYQNHCMLNKIKELNQNRMIIIPGYAIAIKLNIIIMILFHRIRLLAEFT